MFNHNRLIVSAFLVFSAFLIAVGYANLEGVVWGFRYQNGFWSTVDYFDLGNGFKPSQWVAYEIFAVLPFAVGNIILGVALTYLTQKRKVYIV